MKLNHKKVFMLELSEEEAQWLMSVLKNPQGHASHEYIPYKEMRQALYNELERQLS